MALGKISFWTVVVGGGAFIYAVEFPAAFEGVAPGWTKWSAGVRLFAADHGIGSKPPSAAREPRPHINVSVEKVERGPMAFRLESVGAVQPIASVAIRTRIDAEIASIEKPDGAAVKAGDVLVRLDDRQLLTQIHQNAALLEKDQTAIEQATRDSSRAGTLMTTGAGPKLNVENAQTALRAAQAAVAADEALLQNLRVQESWYTLTAPISGRLGVFASKTGNIVRAADTTTAGVLATINQMSPIYVAFPVAQVDLGKLREALKLGPVKLVATPQGGERTAAGEISEIDNLIDSGTGTVMVRATFPNTDELLWPGQLCNLEITLWTDPDDVSVSRRSPVETSDSDYVFTVDIDKGVAHQKQVEVGRLQDNRYVVTSGLSGGETVVDDGKDLLSEGSLVTIKDMPEDADDAAP